MGLKTDEIQETSPDDRLVFKRSHLYAALLPLAFVVGLAAGYLFWGRSASPVARQAAPAQQANQGQPAQEQAAQSVRRYDVPEDDDPSLGPADAPITIIEFSDYECPYCRKWYNEVFLRLQRDYAKEVRIVFRDFPLSSIHPNAIPAAVAANCAGEQGAYWEYHNLLFSSSDLDPETYLEYARQLKLDQKAFQTCLEDGKNEEEVMADYQYAAALGVRSTPTFFVNGIPVIGAQPYDVFSELIEKELLGEIP